MLLKFLRKKKNMKRIIWGLAILIIPAFVIWGAGSSGKKGDKGPSHAGKIFNKKVSFDRYSDMWMVTRDYLKRSFGANIPDELIDQMAWNRIILLELAKKENIEVKDDEVLEKIISFPAFQRNGAFDKKIYKSMVGEGAMGFEERIRDDMRVSKLRDKITSHVSITDEELSAAYREKFEEIKSSYVSVPFNDSENDVRYQGSDLIDFYEENKDSFRKPDEVNVRYIEIAFSNFEKEVYIEDAEIKRYFEDHTKDFQKPDSEEIPILDDTIKIQISDKLTGERKQSLAEELSYKVLDKVLVKNELDEPAQSFTLETKETGFFNMQEEVPGVGFSYEFIKNGFELKPGDISNILVKTDKAFYIIQAKERKPSYMPEFTEVMDEVKKSFTKEMSIKLSEKNAKKFYHRIKNNFRFGKSFEDTANALEKEIKQTEFISRSGYVPMLGPAKEFVESVASLKDNEISSPIKMQESWVIVRLDGYKDIDEIKFIEEKEDFKNDLLEKKKQEVFDEWFERLKKEANFVSYTAE